MRWCVRMCMCMCVCVQCVQCVHYACVCGQYLYDNMLWRLSTQLLTDAGAICPEYRVLIFSSPSSQYPAALHTRIIHPLKLLRKLFL